MVKLISLFTMLATMSLVPSAHAHFVWLERDGDGPARAYFGEWIDDIREKTGGLLDRFKAPRAFLGANNEPLPVKRNDNNLEINAKGRGDVRFVDSSVPAREDKEKGGATKTIYYAKAGRTETAAKLDLELVPTAANGNTFMLIFLGAPLAKGRSHDHRPVQVGKALSHRRTRAESLCRRLGRVATFWKSPTSMTRPAAAATKNSTARATYLAVVRAARRHSLDRKTLKIHR